MLTQIQKEMESFSDEKLELLKQLDTLIQFSTHYEYKERHFVYQLADYILERIQTARVEAQGEKFAGYLEGLDPVEVSRLLGATIYTYIMEPTNADKVSYKISGFSKNGKVLGDMKITAQLKAGEE